MIACATAAACAAGAVVVFGHRAEPQAPAPSVSVQAVAPVPAPARLLDGSTPKPLEQKLATVQDNAATTGTAYSIEPPFMIFDGLTFATEKGTPTRLDGLIGPTAEAVCLDENSRLWACGLQARAALNNLIRKQSVACRTAAPGQGGALVSACRVGAEDLAGQLVRSGFARPDPGRSPRFAEIEAEARSSGRGLWRGGWSIRP